MSEFAALMAPQIDRIRIAVSRALNPKLSPILRAAGLDDHSGHVFTTLRNTMPDRVIDRTALETVFLYQAPEIISGGLQTLTAQGLVAQVDDDRLTLTPSGRELILRCYAVDEAVMDEMWAGHEQLVAELVALTDHAVKAAVDGGPAFSVLAPPYTPPGASHATRLGEDLTALRFHRYDAHIAAWTAAGLTAEQMGALEPGELRNAIEDDTNRRAATPYNALDVDDQERLLGGLTALPA